MQIQKFARKPFEVNAVQVTPENAASIAMWCKGELGSADYKLMGVKTQLACVMVPGTGQKKGEMIPALIGSWVVEHNNSFRVFRQKQFDEMFEELVSTAPVLDNAQLTIDELRAQAEADYAAGVKHEIVGDLFAQSIEEINGIRKGCLVRVYDEMNEFFSQRGMVEEILNETMLAVKMEYSGDVVTHLAREVGLEDKVNWVRVSNVDSPQHGWVGWLINGDETNPELARVAFRSMDWQNGTNDRVFAYFPRELEPIGREAIEPHVPSYEI